MTLNIFNKSKKKGIGRNVIAFCLVFVLTTSLSFGAFGIIPPQKVYAAQTDTFTRASGTNANGYGTWTVPAGVTSADVACWGGGGAAFQGVVNGGGGAGGGGGAFASSTVSSLVEGTSYTIFIGLGGTTSGADGATSTFATTTVVASPGAGGQNSTTLFGNGGLASLSTGTVKNNGGNGGIGVDGGTNKDRGGGGGGAGGPHGAGGVGADATTVGGAGGDGDAGSGGTGGPTETVGTDNANGGGGGGGSTNDTSGFAGGIPGGGGGGGNAGVGAGASGQCTVTYTVQLPPTVTTSAASGVTDTTITLTSSGNITADGGSNSTVRGFASSTSATLATGVATSTESGSFGTGVFSSTMGNLTANMTYYWRAYATNPNGTGYGSIQSTSTLPAAPDTPTFSATAATTTGLSWVDATGATTYKLQQCQASTCTTFSDISGLSTTTYSLAGNTTYDYAVRGVNGSGLGAWSATSSRLTLPDRPTAPTFTSNIATSSVISWTGSAASYTLIYCTGSTCVQSSGLTGVSTTTNPLAGNTAYTFSVLPTNATGDGLRSATSSTLTTLPDQPTSLAWVAPITATSAVMQWVAPTGGVSSYKLVYCTGATCVSNTDLSSGVTSTSTNVLVGNTSYTFAIRGTNATGDGLVSATSTATTTPPNIPGTPTFTNVLTTSLTVNWTNSVGSSTSYKVERCAGGGCSDFSEIVSGVATTTYNDSSLTESTSYSYRIRGTNATGDGLYSTSAATSTIAVTPPAVTTDAINNSNVTQSTASLTASITSTGGENASVRGFASSTDSTLSTGVATSTETGPFGLGSFSSTMGGLTANMTYYYRAYATNSSGTGYGSIQSLLTLPTAPSAPTYSNPTATTTVVSWTNPTGATTYSLEQCLYGTGTCSLFTGISGLSTTTYGLAGNTVYDYAVRGTNATGDSVFSATTTTQTVPAVPGTPAFSSVSFTTLTVNWPGSVGSSTSYKVERCAGGGCTDFAQIASGVGTTTYNDSSLTHNTSYNYRIRGTNGVGDGLYSSAGATTTLVASAATVTTDAASSIVATSTTLNGTIIDIGSVNPTMRGFASSTDPTLTTGVSTSTESGSFSAGAFTATSSGLTGNTSYSFRAYATNVGGTGYGNILSFLTVPAVPGTPTFADTSQASLTVNWSGSVGSSTSYKVERCTGNGCTDFAEIASGVGTTTYNDSGLTQATEYRYQIRGTNSTGDGLYSAAGSVTTTGTTIVTGGGGGGGGAIGGDAPAGQGIVDGGSQAAGEEIGSESGFVAPLSSAVATAWGGGWTNAGNALADDDSYATATTFVASDYYDFNFSIPATDTITGITVKLAAKGSTAAGTIGTELSWDSGTGTTTSAIATGTLTTSDVVYTLGGASNLWGRTWTPSEFSNANFRVRVIANPSSNTLSFDSIQLRIYHQATGGGGGGGGEI